MSNIITQNNSDKIDYSKDYIRPLNNFSENKRPNYIAIAIITISAIAALFYSYYNF